jgi:hypothetical protein
MPDGYHFLSDDSCRRNSLRKFKHWPVEFYFCLNQVKLLLFFHLLYSPPWALAFAFQFHDLFTDGRTLWASDQFVARPLPKHRTAYTQNKHIHTPNIHALCGIRTHDPSFQASEDSTCPRPLGCRDRQIASLEVYNI